MKKKKFKIGDRKENCFPWLTITDETQLLPTMCIKHSAISVLHCSFGFLISFGVVGQNGAGR